MNQLLEQLKKIWADMSPGRRMVTASILATVVVGFAVVIASQTTERWKDLGRGDAEDMSHAVAALKEKQIPVRMSDAGVLQVPEERFHEAKVSVAMLAADGSVGMELFNETTFGQSAFQEKVNYHRALEGELARTIRSLNGVKSARVHLNIPKKRIFRNEQKKPSASVKLHLNSGELDKRQIAGIRYTVSSAIEGLASGAVTIIDQRGNMLARPQGSDMMVGENFMDLQMQTERQIEQRILDLLEPLLGVGKVSAKVTAEMDFRRVVVTEKDIDPDKQVVIGETRSEETSNSTETPPGGVAGAAGNAPGQAGANKNTNNTARTAKKESIQYETETKVRKITMPQGRLKSLNVGVVVDGIMEDNAAGVPTWVPLSEDKIQGYRKLVASALGIDPTRGDQFTLVSSEFKAIEDLDPVLQPTVLSPMVKQGILWGGLLLLMLLLVFGVVRPMIKLAQPTPGQLALAGGSVMGPNGELINPAVAALPAAKEPEGLVQLGERLRLKAIQSTRTEPERAVEILRHWLTSEE